MAVWRKWEVVILDDQGFRHYADFETKDRALAFCKAMKRMGAKEVLCCKEGLRDCEVFRHPAKQEQQL